MGGPSVATGYVTVDAMNRCTSESTFPIPSSSDDSFAPLGTGLASDANVLWGDYS